MSSLSEIVNVEIDVRSPGITRAGFGVPLIAAHHTVFLERVRAYSEVEEMVEDGFAATSPITRLAQAIKSQSPGVTKFKIGRLENDAQQTISIKPVETKEGFVHSVDVFSPSGELHRVAHTNGAAETVSSIITALMADLNAITGITAATEAPTPVTITATSDAGLVFDYRNIAGFYDTETIGKGGYIQDVTADPGIALDLSAIRDEDQDWYGLILNSGSVDQILAAADWAEARRVIFGAHTFFSLNLRKDVVGDPGSELKNRALDRIFIKFGGFAVGVGVAAWMGRMLSETPGTATWAYKTLSGVPADKLTTSQRDSLDAKNTNHYTTVGGRNVTRYGIMASGQPIDITRYIDYLAARLQENIYGLLVSRPKIPYTDAGIDLVGSEIRAELQRGVDAGALAADPAPTVTTPRAADISPIDKANRVLPDVKFTAQLTGAIHKIITIRGTLVV